jgi:predicted DNA binding CopG/RHH family protein
MARAQAEYANRGGKINRLKKFNKWFKSIGTKVKVLNKNLKPIKQAATQRAADYIKYYNNPEAQAQAGIDMFQKEAGDTGKLFTKGKKRGQSFGSASVPDYEPAPETGLRRGTFISPMQAPASIPPQAVDVNDDGEPDGYFYPNEAQWFGAGMKKRGKGKIIHDLRDLFHGKGVPPGGTSGMQKYTPYKYQYIQSNGAVYQGNRPPPSQRGSGAKKTSSPWIAHVKKYAAEHGMKYGEALKEAKATYKKTGGAMLPAGMTYADLYY